jgi:hypothetical protein
MPAAAQALGPRAAAGTELFPLDLNHHPTPPQPNTRSNQFED